MLYFLIRCGGRDAMSFWAFSVSFTQSVYKYFEHLTLNLVVVVEDDFCTLMCLASFRRAFSKNSLISLISFGIFKKFWNQFVLFFFGWRDTRVLHVDFVFMSHM